MEDSLVCSALEGPAVSVSRTSPLTAWENVAISVSSGHNGICKAVSKQYPFALFYKINILCDVFLSLSPFQSGSNPISQLTR